MEERLDAYEAGVKGGGAPSRDCGRVGLVVIVEVPAWVELSPGLDEIDEAVGRSLGDELDQHAKGGKTRGCGAHGVC